MRRDAAPGLWTGQTLHFAGLGLLLALVLVAWRALGAPHPVAFWTAIAVPIAHQVTVWLAWRLELTSGATSARLGFRGYLALFFALLAGRLLATLALGWVDRGSLGLAPRPRTVLATLLALPAVYTFTSIVRYFGFVRAAGADHFDPAYRARPLVDQGIFRLTRNGMYVFAFLALWSLAVGFDSAAALVVAAFSHAYVWVHYFATEKPDMRFLHAAH